MPERSQDELQWQVYLKHFGEALRDKLGNKCYEAFMDFGLEYMREALKEFYVRLPDTVDPYVLDCLKSALDVCTSLRLQPLDGPEPMKRISTALPARRPSCADSICDDMRGCHGEPYHELWINNVSVTLGFVESVDADCVSPDSMDWHTVQHTWQVCMSS